MNRPWFQDGDIHSAAKRFVDQYVKRRKPLRLHTTSEKLSLADVYDCPQTADRMIRHLKPKGIWYGIADSWIDWCLSESFGGIHQYIYEIVVDKSRILTIDNISDFEKFEKEHLEKPNTNDMPEWLKKVEEIYPNKAMNYSKVAENFGGIEIAPYQWEKRLESMWYYGWDCASGCIWSPNAIKDLRLFAYYDPQKGEFVKTSLQPDKTKV